MPSKKDKKTVQSLLLRQYSQSIGMLFLFFIGLVAFTYIASTAVAVDSDVSTRSLLGLVQEKALHKTIRDIQSRKSYIKEPEIIKAIYATAYTASVDARLNALIELIKATELNSIVIDIKLDGGSIIFKTGNPIIATAGTERIMVEDMKGLVDRLHEEGIYTIARMTVFQDPALVSARPDLAIGDKRGGVWKDWKGVTWLDPHSSEVWEYVLAVAHSAIYVGFKEINFDYIRFPSDGPLSQVVYHHGTGANKVDTLNSFFKYLSDELSGEGVKISADLFGITLWSDSDFNIGQTLVGAAPHFDYIAPMVYPSHYPDGFNGFANPAEYPYEIIAQNLDRGIGKIEGMRATLRPWLQDFDLGAVYSADKVRAQITATEERDTNGWMLWNASNNYTASALR